MDFIGRSQFVFTIGWEGSLGRRDAAVQGWSAVVYLGAK